jgi:hypothetical protein
MCNRLTFRGNYGLARVALPFDLAAQIAGWSTVQTAMLKEVPAEFARDEWAYLATFLDAENLWRSFQQSFGNYSKKQDSPALLARPRGSVGLWLPNNVNLLGPLMLIVVSLTGNFLRIKAGSRSRDLTAAFLEFSRSHAEQEPLRSYLHNFVHNESFAADDPRNREMAESSAVRIVFGSDIAASAIHSLPHPVDSVGISFTDRRSEAWLELDRCNDETLRQLIKVFAIYGQAGCTSPSRVVLLNASRADALGIRDRLVALWPAVIRHRPEMNVASDNLRAWQLARATGWDPVLLADNRAVVSVGDFSLPVFDGQMELRIVTASPDEACGHLPKNIQTIGHALRNPNASQWRDLLLQTRVTRFVPLAKMHHFEAFWDGQDVFAQLFAYTRVTA